MFSCSKGEGMIGNGRARRGAGDPGGVVAHLHRRVKGTGQTSPPNQRAGMVG